MKQYPEQAGFARRDAEKKALRERDVVAVAPTVAAFLTLNN